jgi:hypothetical protein
LQYRYTNSTYNSWVYDYAQDGGPNYVNNNNYRRTFELPITSTDLTTNFPAVYFNDLAPDDYLPTATPVLFSVDMNGAVETNGQAFVPGSDSVYINGMFAGATPSFPNPTYGTSQYWYPWSGGDNLQGAPAGYQMIEEGTSTIYTNTVVIPAGTPVALSYQYGVDPDSLYGGPLENEARQSDSGHSGRGQGSGILARAPGRPSANEHQLDQFRVAEHSNDRRHELDRWLQFNEWFRQRHELGRRQQYVLPFNQAVTEMD